MDIKLTRVDKGSDILGALSVNSCTQGDACAEHLLDSSLEIDSHALGAKFLGNIDDVSKLEVAVVLHVLLLLSVTRSLLKSLNDQGSGSGENSDETLSVLDHHLDLDLDAAPVSGGLLDVFTDLLGGHTEGTALGSEGSS